MENVQRFGDELHREAFTSGKVFGRRIKYYLLALLGLGFGVLMATAEDAFTYYNDETLLLLAISGAVVVLFLLIAHLAVKGGEIVIFESGVSFTRGSKTRSIYFGDVASVYRKSGVILDGLVVGGLIGMLPIFQVHKFFLLGKAATPMLTLRHRRVPGWKYMFRELEAAYTKYVMKDISPATIANANITFGDQLQLRGGNLVLTKKKWRQTTESIVPFEAINSINGSEIVTLGGFANENRTNVVTLEGFPNEKGKKEDLVTLGDDGRNTEILRQIVKMMQTK